VAASLDLGHTVSSVLSVAGNSTAEVVAPLHCVFRTQLEGPTFLSYQVMHKQFVPIETFDVCGSCVLFYLLNIAEAQQL
jgi:hypothetical protein